MALFGSLSTVQAQVSRPEAFAAAFAYLAEVTQPGSPAAARVQALAAGDSNRVELGGGTFAIEQAYESRVRADGFFESHRKYIDVQVVLAGDEVMEVADIAGAPVRQAYSEERDVIIYADCAGASPLRIAAGQAAVFFPVDVHMPCLRTGRDGVLVRKTVVKVPVW